MNIFGIQIRAASTTNLYKDVDRLLAENKNYDMERATTTHALEKMLRDDRHFSVCTIRDCAKLNNLCIPQKRMQIYSAAHCIDWNAMSPEYRQMLIAYILDDFRAVLNPKTT